MMGYKKPMSMVVATVGDQGSISDTLGVMVPSSGTAAHVNPKIGILAHLYGKVRSAAIQWRVSRTLAHY